MLLMSEPKAPARKEKVYLQLNIYPTTLPYHTTLPYNHTPPGSAGVLGFRLLILHENMLPSSLNSLKNRSMQETLLWALAYNDGQIRICPCHLGAHTLLSRQSLIKSSH